MKINYEMVHKNDSEIRELATQLARLRDERDELKYRFVNEVTSFLRKMTSVDHPMTFSEINAGLNMKLPSASVFGNYAHQALTARQRNIALRNGMSIERIKMMYGECYKGPSFPGLHSTTHWTTKTYAEIDSYGNIIPNTYKTVKNAESVYWWDDDEYVE